jgi:hypothetical protein
MARVLPIIEELGMLEPKADNKGFVFTIDGKPFTTKKLERIWNLANLKATKKFGTKRVSLYPATKHSFGMSRLNAGATYDELRAIFGHRDEKSIHRYAAFQVDYLREVMKPKIHRKSSKIHKSERNASMHNHSEMYERDEGRHFFDPCSAYQVKISDCGFRIDQLK